jgi:hypothetical protein
LIGDMPEQFRISFGKMFLPETCDQRGFRGHDREKSVADSRLT